MSGQSPGCASITLRPVSPDDHEFLVGVYANTRAEEMALLPWTNEQRDAFIRWQFAAQQEHYAKHYPAADHDIIMFDGRQAGRLYVARLVQEIRIVDITLLPSERNAGIGSYLITQLLDEADRVSKVTRIYVEEFNPSLSLFKRLGFSPSQQNGIHVLMQRNPLVNSSHCR
jgi:GNAT superfamily N-acetyltransferase